MKTIERDLWGNSKKVQGRNLRRNFRRLLLPPHRRNLRHNTQPVSKNNRLLQRLRPRTDSQHSSLLLCSCKPQVPSNSISSRRTIQLRYRILPNRSLSPQILRRLTLEQKSRNRVKPRLLDRHGLPHPHATNRTNNMDSDDHMVRILVSNNNAPRRFTHRQSNRLRRRVHNANNLTIVIRSQNA